MITRQNGNANVINNYSLFPQPKYKYYLKAEKNGLISKINCEEIGLSALSLGAGRKIKDAPIDLSAGIFFNKIIGDYVNIGDTIALLYSSSINSFSEISNRISSAITINNQ